MAESNNNGRNSSGNMYGADRKLGTGNNRSRTGNMPQSVNNRSRTGNMPQSANNRGRAGSMPQSANNRGRTGNTRKAANNKFGRANNLQMSGAAENGNNRNVKMKKKKTSRKEKIIIAASIIAGVIILAVMILNIPIIPVERTKGGNTYTEHISIIRYIKELQPLAEIEGLLSEDTNSYELVSGAEQVDDKRDFTNDQIIEGQFTVLVLGFDESRELSDVMMLFLFDINNHKLDILQIPRDSYVPDYTSSETGKINSVYVNGDESLIPIQRTVNAVRETFGIPIDRYVTTGCDDIVEIVDLIGGIPINLPEDVFYSYDKILYAGEQVLNGEQAELMVRARKGYSEGDIGRVKAQRIFMAACMEKALDMGAVELTSFIKEVNEKKLIATDMTLGELSILADFGTLIDMDKVTVQLVPGEGAYNGDYSVWSIHKQPTIDMLNKYFRPYQVDLGYDDLPIVELVEEGCYMTDIYDENQDTLEDISKGATPGESKKKTNHYNSSNIDDSDYDDYSYDDYSYDDYGYDDYSYDDYDYSDNEDYAYEESSYDDSAYSETEEIYYEESSYADETSSDDYYSFN